jgi:predicted component of type VI protein secretion system
MIELDVLSGKMAGAVWSTRHFPVLIGRSPAAHLRAEDEGVWERHLQIDFAPEQGFVLTALPDATATVNGQPTGRALLRNGDTVQCGALMFQFWLSPLRQASLRPREAAVWILLGLVSVAQFALIYWLSQ